MNELFRHIAHKASKTMGSPWAFVIAFGVIIFWGLSGIFFNFSNTWQLVINTGTTILTFLMVFLIQNTQNRDAYATQLKLDEIIKALGKADNEFIDVEDATEDRLSALEKNLKKFQEEHKH